MTIAVAWVRTLAKGGEELVFCSDSRLSSGKRFDHCQKVFRFARSDAVICFAGRTDWAYPMVIAAVKAADLHTPSQTGALSLSKFKSHIVNILNQMQKEVHSFAAGEDIPEVTFLFGGYDSWSKSFRIWRIEFDKQENKFLDYERTGSNKFGGLGKVEIAGDPEWIEAVRDNLKKLVQSKYGLNMLGLSDNGYEEKIARHCFKCNPRPPCAKFDLEPFEVIRDLLLKASAVDSIGGSPQAVKVYQYMSTADVGVFWPSLNSGRLFVSGRPLLSYERSVIKSVIDPDTLNSTWLSGNTSEGVDQLQKAIVIEENRRANKNKTDRA